MLAAAQGADDQVSRQVPRDAAGVACEWEAHFATGQQAEQWQSELNRLGRIAWNVKLMERYEHGTGVATYLANYLKGGPIGNKRLIQ